MFELLNIQSKSLPFLPEDRLPSFLLTMRSSKRIQGHIVLLINTVRWPSFACSLGETKLNYAQPMMHAGRPTLPKRNLSKLAFAANGQRARCGFEVVDTQNLAYPWTWKTYVHKAHLSCPPTTMTIATTTNDFALLPRKKGALRRVAAKRPFSEFHTHPPQSIDVLMCDEPLPWPGNAAFDKLVQRHKDAVRRHERSIEDAAKYIFDSLASKSVRFFASFHTATMSCWRQNIDQRRILDHIEHAIREAILRKVPWTRVEDPYAHPMFGEGRRRQEEDGENAAAPKPKEKKTPSELECEQLLAPKHPTPSYKKMRAQGLPPLPKYRKEIIKLPKKAVVLEKRGLMFFRRREIAKQRERANARITKQRDALSFSHDLLVKPSIARKGVSLVASGNFHVRLHFQKKSRPIGTFSTFDQAERAVSAAEKYFKRFESQALQEEEAQKVAAKASAIGKAAAALSRSDTRESVSETTENKASSGTRKSVSEKTDEYAKASSKRTKHVAVSRFAEIVAEMKREKKKLMNDLSVSSKKGTKRSSSGPATGLMKKQRQDGNGFWDSYESSALGSTTKGSDTGKPAQLANGTGQPVHKTTVDPINHSSPSSSLGTKAVPIAARPPKFAPTQQGQYPHLNVPYAPMPPGFPYYIAPSATMQPFPFYSSPQVVPRRSPVTPKAPAPLPAEPQKDASPVPAEPKEAPVPPPEIDRGITIRPSGKWQAQMFFKGKSRYLGVRTSKREGVILYFTARSYLKSLPASALSTPKQADVAFLRARVKGKEAADVGDLSALPAEVKHYMEYLDTEGDRSKLPERVQGFMEADDAQKRVWTYGISPKELATTTATQVTADSSGERLVEIRLSPGSARKALALSPNPDENIPPANRV